MKLFISYARVDKAYCTQVADVLDNHDVWFDHRLYAGQNWWNQILQRLEWCDAFVYVLTPDSVASPYCREEFNLIQRLKKPIFPVLVDSNTKVPESLRDIHYADFTIGPTIDAVKMLLNSIYRTEMEAIQAQPTSINALSESEYQMPASATTNIIGRAAQAMDDGKFDQAVFLLKQAKEKGFQSKYWDINGLLADAEIALGKQMLEREVRVEYQGIGELVRHKRTRQVGCQALKVFMNEHSNYDPEGLVRLCGSSADIAPPNPNPGGGGGSRAVGSVVSQTQISQPTRSMPIKLLQPQPQPQSQSAVAPGKPIDLPMLELVTIPAGVAHGVEVGAFAISRYPITNEQWERFVKDGFGDAQWWRFSPYAEDWFKRNSKARPPYYRGDTLPRENVCWYDAMAFCNWLREKMNCPVTLPTGAQWRRAASGDDDRLYPWGNDFDSTRANTRESRIRRTTSVKQYPDSASPYGIVDMTGNVWEWCLDTSPDETTSIMLNTQRRVQGGSFLTTHDRARTTFDFYLDPEYYYGTLGFRVVVSE